MPALADLPAPGAAAPVPVQQAAPAAAPAEAAPPALPDPFDDVADGTIPGVLIPPIHKDAKPDVEQQFVVDNLHVLTGAGLDYYEAKDQHTALFNPAKVTVEQLEAADKTGTLEKLLPTVEKAKQTDATPEAAAPEVDPAAAETAASTPGALAALPPSGAGPVKDSVPAPVTRARLANIQPKQTSPIVPNPVPGKLAKRAI